MSLTNNIKTQTCSYLTIFSPSQMSSHLTNIFLCMFLTLAPDHLNIINLFFNIKPVKIARLVIYKLRLIMSFHFSNFTNSVCNLITQLGDTVI